MSTIRKYYDTAMGRATQPKESAIESGEAIVVGGLAGLVAGQRAGGLDYAMSSGGMSVPLDGAAGATAMLAATFAPMGQGTREMVRRGAGHLLAIASFRKTEAWSKPAAGSPASGEFGDEDPIVRAAQGL